MPTNDHLTTALQQQAKDLSRRGRRARLDRSDQLLLAAGQNWRYRMTEANQRLWRLAGIAHCASMGFSGNWHQALIASMPGTGSLYVPHSSTHTPETQKLTALTLVNHAVSSYRHDLRQHRDAAHVHAARALDILDSLADKKLNPWKAVCRVILALKEADGIGSGAQARNHARRALECIDQKRQPELYLLALRLAGRGDGVVRRRFHRPRRATLQAEECLYYFNE